MKLESIIYTEFDEKPYAWRLDEFEFSNINLMVGKNATGKSRVLRVVNGLARLVDGSIQPNSLSDGNYAATFTGEKEHSGPNKIKYSFKIHENKVTNEELYIDDVEKLKRGAGGKATLEFAKNRILIDIQVPETVLAVSARRDSDQHPFFEYLHQWASTVKYLEFSKIEGQLGAAFEGPLTFEMANSSPLQNSLHLITKLAKERFGRSFDSAVINDMRRVGYEISEFGLMPVKGMSIPLAKSSSPLVLYVVENGIDLKMIQGMLSNGMLRTLATLIFLHASRLNKKRDCLLIDDIGEGLDYDRAKKLISIIVEEAERGYMTLVMSTNDRFVMNGVPLKYWSVIQRDLGKVKVFNIKNSEGAFLEFEKYGFNNFDFFSKEFFAKEGPRKAG